MTAQIDSHWNRFPEGQVTLIQLTWEIVIIIIIKNNSASRVLREDKLTGKKNLEISQRFFLLSAFNILIDNLDMRKNNKCTEQKASWGHYEPRGRSEYYTEITLPWKWNYKSGLKFCIRNTALWFGFFSYKLNSLSERTDTEKNLGVLLKDMDFTITYYLRKIIWFSNWWTLIWKCVILTTSVEDRIHTGIATRTEGRWRICCVKDQKRGVLRKTDVAE